MTQIVKETAKVMIPILNQTFQELKEQKEQ